MQAPTTVLNSLEGVSSDIPKSIKDSIPNLLEGKGQLIFLLQDGIKIFNSILRILCETDPNIKDWDYQNLLQSFIDFAQLKVDNNEDSEDEEDDAEDDAEESEDAFDAEKSINDRLNEMSLDELAPIIRDFLSMFNINNLSFAVFSRDGEINFSPSEDHDRNNIFCIFKDGEEIYPLYFQEAERNLIFDFLVERDS